MSSTRPFFIYEKRNDNFTDNGKGDLLNFVVEDDLYHRTKVRRKVIRCKCIE